MKWLGFITFCIFVSVFCLITMTFQWSERKKSPDVTVILTDDGTPPASIEPASGLSVAGAKIEQDALMSAPAFRNIEPAALSNEEDFYQESLFPDSQKKAIKKSLKKEKEL